MKRTGLTSLWRLGVLLVENPWTSLADSETRSTRNRYPVSSKSTTKACLFLREPVLAGVNGETSRKTEIHLGFSNKSLQCSEPWTLRSPSSAVPASCDLPALPLDFGHRELGYHLPPLVRVVAETSCFQNTWLDSLRAE